MGKHQFTPEDRLIDVRQCLQMVPVSKSTWHKGVKDGAYPSSIKIGGRTFWRYSDVLKFVRDEWEPGDQYKIPPNGHDPSSTGSMGLIG